MKKKSCLLFIFSLVLINFFLISLANATSEKIDVFVKLKEEPVMGLRLQTIVNNSYLKEKFNQGRDRVFEIDPNDLEKLYSRKDVEKIIRLEKIYATLQDSTEIINSTEANSLTIGGEYLNGTGQTVCVIDTGINYSHPDLSTAYIDGYDFVNDDNDPMDDNGHGTHVSGIIAASGGIQGVAPGSKIVSLKVLDETGSGYVYDVIPAINWCINKSKELNISVISMSLGCNNSIEGYTTYCDGLEDGCLNNLITTAIENATTHNISVVAATGNLGNFNAISSPACISKVIAVGSTTKFDSISSFSDRNFLVKLFAPGSSINSTKWNPLLNDPYCIGEGNYMICWGTSSSTPHVAGAISIINQKLKTLGRIMDSLEIEQLLFDTGKKITDSENVSNNFSRIDVFNALKAIKEISIPQIFPSNGSYTNLNTTNLTCSISSPDYPIENVTFSIYNSSNVTTLIKNSSGFDTNVTVNLNLSQEGNYSWSCLAVNNNSEWSETNKNTFYYDISFPEISELILVISYNSATISWNNSEMTNYTLSQDIENNTFSENHSLTLFNLDSTTYYEYNLTSCDLASNCIIKGFNFTTSTKPKSPKRSNEVSSTKIVELTPFQNKTFEVIDSNTLKKGKILKLKQGEEVLFNLKNNNHTLKINSVSNEKVYLTVHSEPIYLAIDPTEEIKINVTSPWIYDFSITLHSIEEGNISLTIKQIEEYTELAKTREIYALEKKTEKQDIKTEKDSFLNKMGVIIVVPWYFFAIPIVVFILWIIGLWTIIQQYKSYLKFNERSAAAKRAWFRRRWKKEENKNDTN